MKKFLFAPLFAAAGFLLAASTAPVLALDFPDDPTWTTFLKINQIVETLHNGNITVGNMEGLTGDDNGNFYVADRGSDDNPTNACHVWRINTNNPDPDTNVDLVGRIDLVPCRPSGLTFGPDGALYITTSSDPGFIYKLTPNAGNPTAGDALGTQYAIGVPGANGVAFSGNLLYVTDGTKNKGRVWQVAAGGGDCAAEDDCVEIFRTQPQRNSVAWGGGHSW